MIEKLIPSKKQWESWSLPSKLTAIGTLLSAIGLLVTAALSSIDLFNKPSVTNKTVSKNNQSIGNVNANRDVNIKQIIIEGEDNKVVSIYAELFDSSKKLLKTLQPSPANVFNRMKIGERRFVQTKLEAEKQLIPLKLVEIQEVVQFGIKQGEYELQLTPLRKKVRAYMLSHEQIEDYFPVIDIK